MRTAWQHAAPLVFVGGQIGWNALQQFESDDFVAQARCALQNIVAVLAEAGARPEHVVRMTWYVVDRREYLAHARAARKRVPRGHGPPLSGDDGRRGLSTDRRAGQSGNRGDRRHSGRAKRKVIGHFRPPARRPRRSSCKNCNRVRGCCACRSCMPTSVQEHPISGDVMSIIRGLAAGHCRNPFRWPRERASRRSRDQNPHTRCLIVRFVRQPDRRQGPVGNVALGDDAVLRGANIVDAGPEGVYTDHAHAVPDEDRDACRTVPARGGQPPWLRHSHRRQRNQATSSSTRSLASRIRRRIGFTVEGYPIGHIGGGDPDSEVVGVKRKAATATHPADPDQLLRRDAG